MLRGEGQFYPPKSSIFEETYIRDNKNGKKTVQQKCAVESDAPRIVFDDAMSPRGPSTCGTGLRVAIAFANCRCEGCSRPAKPFGQTRPVKPA